MTYAERWDYLAEKEFRTDAEESEWDALLSDYYDTEQDDDATGMRFSDGSVSYAREDHI